MNMKKIGIISVAMLFSFAICNAQTTLNIASNYIKKPSKSENKNERKEIRKREVFNVNQSSLSNFRTDFIASQNVAWHQANNFDEATFTENGQEATAYYGLDGQLVGITTPKSFTDLPESGQKRINKQYKGYSVESVLLFTNRNYNDTDPYLYTTQFADPDNYFVQMANGKERIVVQANSDGDVFFYKKLN